MNPAELREKMAYRRAAGKSYEDLEEEYREKERESVAPYNYSKKVVVELAKMKSSGEYEQVMNPLDYFRINSREKLRKKFSDMMFFYETINPDWINCYNKLEEGKTGNMSEEIDAENFSMNTLVDEALSLPDITYGNISPEKMRDIRISALTMFYANKIAHQSKYLRETYLSHYLNFEEKNNYTLDDSLSQGKFREISNRLKAYYMYVTEYSEAKARGDSQDDLKRIAAKAMAHKKILIKLGIDENNKLYKDKYLRTLVTLEKDAFAIKDAAMSDLVAQLASQRDISYGKMYDLKGQEVLVVDLPWYGQFSVHTKEEECIAKNNVPQYPYPVYGVDLGRALLVMSKSSSAKYVKQKCGNKANVVKSLMTDFDSKEEAHQICVKLGYNKNTLKKIYNNGIGQPQSQSI